MLAKMTLTPRSPYFFGGEQNAGFGFTKSAPYFIRSEKIPTQTSVLGLARYSVLKRYGLLADRLGMAKALPPQVRQQQDAYIGSSSFSFMNEAQSFGCIEEISPVFLEFEGVLYGRCPLNHVQQEEQNTYRPFSIERKNGWMDGRDAWVSQPRYNPKQGCYNGWVSLDGKQKLAADEGIFLPQEQVGIIRSEAGVQEEGFFKKEYINLKKGWRFVYFIAVKALADLPEQAVVQMGQAKSLFYMTCEPAEVDWRTLPGHLRANIGYDGFVYYAVSDCRPGISSSGLYRLCDLAVTQVRPFRSLVTNREAQSYYRSMQKTQRFDLLRSGSVFYVPRENQSNFESVFRQAAYQQVGFNQLFVIGGSKV